MGSTQRDVHWGRTGVCAWGFRVRGSGLGGLGVDGFWAGLWDLRPCCSLSRRRYCFRVSKSQQSSLR